LRVRRGRFGVFPRRRPGSRNSGGRSGAGFGSCRAPASGGGPSGNWTRAVDREKPRRGQRRRAPHDGRAGRRRALRDPAAAGVAMSRVLVVDDESGIRKVVRDALEREGHEVETAVDGQEALDLCEQGAFDLIVTDLAMPRMSGLELVREIRQKSAVPILVLTVRHEEREKVRLLDAGADDYVTKPFGVEELLARARALLRREKRNGEVGTASWGDVSVDLETRSVKKRGKAVHLTPTEFGLLAKLIQKPGAVWTHRQLLSAVWGTTAGVSNDTLRVHMGSLRRKLEDDPNRPRWIKTEPWVGYRFTPES